MAGLGGRPHRSVRGQVAEHDLNPVLVGPEGVVVVDAKLRLAEVGPEPDAALRQLSRPA
jgi:hypothetical protein